MIVKSRIQGRNDWLLNEEFPNLLNQNIGMAEKRFSLKKHPIAMSTYQVLDGGVFMLYADVRFEEAVRFRNAIEGEVLCSRFIFSRFEEKQSSWIGHNIHFIPTSNSSCEIPVGKDYTYFLLLMSKEYYFNLIARESIVHASFVAMMDKGQFGPLVPNDLMVTSEMKKLIYDIRDARFTGELKRLHLKARIMELLVCQLEQMRSAPKKQLAQPKKEDILRIEQAYFILKDRYTDPPTLIALSHEVMLNDFKLKKEFKAHYGMTIYAFVTQLRMVEAKKLLAEGNCRVGEVANIVGYKYHANFTEAFKKYYGFLPRAMKT